MHSNDQSRHRVVSGRGGQTRYNLRGTTFNSTNNRTLQVRKIPASMNNIAKLNEHFAQFGQIVNIQVNQ